MGLSKTAKLKWLLAGPTVIAMGLLLFILAPQNTIFVVGFLIFLVGLLLLVMGLLLTMEGWFNRVGIQYYVVAWLNK